MSEKNVTMPIKPTGPYIGVIDVGTRTVRFVVSITLILHKIIFNVIYNVNHNYS